MTPIEKIDLGKIDSYKRETLVGIAGVLGVPVTADNNKLDVATAINERIDGLQTALTAQPSQSGGGTAETNAAGEALEEVYISRTIQTRLGHTYFEGKVRLTARLAADAREAMQQPRVPPPEPTRHKPGEEGEEQDDAGSDTGRDDSRTEG